MSRRGPATGGRNKRVRGITLLWILVMTAIVFILLYYEQIALLYVLANLGMTALLALVAFANLHATERGVTAQGAPADDSAAIGSGLTSSIGATATASTQPRRAKRK
jgi:hypothetical protein